MNCNYAGKCSGCSWIEIPYESQKHQKIERLQSAIQKNLKNHSISEFEIQFCDLGKWRTRDRVDITFKELNGEMICGLYEISSSGRNLLDINACPQMSEGLEKWYKEFKETIPLMKVGSARLRIGPQGQKGVWLDLPNLEVKKQLEEKVWFEKLFRLEAFVEVGQRRKELTHALKLTDPMPLPWIKTKFGNTEVPVYSAIGGFSQPGSQVNLKLVSVLEETIQKMIPEGRYNWLEIGSGTGNLTVPLIEYANKITAIENDSLALMGLNATLDEAERILEGDLCEIEIVPLSFLSKNFTSQDMDAEFLLVDPPRSGLGIELSNKIANSEARGIVYVSCFEESFIEDCKILEQGGFKIRQLTIVDQFPQTAHYEIVAGLMK